MCLGSDLVDWLFAHVDGFLDRRDARKYASKLLKVVLSQLVCVDFCGQDENFGNTLQYPLYLVMLV